MRNEAITAHVKLFAKISLPLTLFLFAVMAPISATSEGLATGKIRTTYQLNLSGMRFARVVMESQINGDQYHIGVSARSSSFARLVRFKGATTSTGTFVSNEARPNRYALNYEIARSGRQIGIDFNDVDATIVSVDPPRGPSIWRQPLLPEHFLNVTDPVSAFIFPLDENQPDGTQACNRVTEVLDGLHRFELKMDYIRTISEPSYEHHGQTVPVFVCSFNYRPIVGHNTNDDNDMYYWANHEGVEIWLMPIYSAGVLLPIHGIFPTPYGRAVFQANTMELTGFAQQAAANQ